MPRKRIAIVGAGLTGCTVAAALSKYGYRPTIFECEPQVMSAAARYNEGKIHLGYTYAMDKTLETARLLAKAALMFEPILLKYFGPDIKKIVHSKTFNYAVHKDSLVSPDEYEAFARDVSSIASDQTTAASSYFGVDIHKRPSRLTKAELTKDYNPDAVSAVFRTNEVSIDPETLADIIDRILPTLPGLTVRVGSEVLSIKKRRSEYILQIKNHSGDLLTEPFDCVINTSWRDRLRLDTFVGLKPPASSLFRLKYFVRTHKKVLSLPNTTIVTGAFGDVLNYDSSTFLSWYPVGRVEWYEGIFPRKIEAVLSDRKMALCLKNEIVAGLAKIFPALKSFPDIPFDVKGNWIFAKGKSDVNVKHSLLHHREYSGITKKGLYYSINPGKYTSAPYFANEFAKAFHNEKK